ncbi:MAG: YhdT family protein [Coriobacteriales bacterium]|nr:YhdT family protein [Coriobacteriales bacterium]MBQ6585463.1 YhdT family protein [Coriobacteriales bacterium]
MSDEHPMSYDDKLRQTNRDALWALGALGAVVLVWIVSGFGLAGVDVRVAGVPLWVVTSLLGTWAAAIVAAIVLSRRFVEFDLEDADKAEAQVSDHE